MMSDEYKNLKSALREALKRERSAPWAEQAQRVAEREEVEAHLAKARSRYERYQREQREKKVLQEVKKEERAKRAEGKGEWPCINVLVDTRSCCSNYGNSIEVYVNMLKCCLRGQTMQQRREQSKDNVLQRAISRLERRGSRGEATRMKRIGRLNEVLLQSRRCRRSQA